MYTFQTQLYFSLSSSRCNYDLICSSQQESSPVENGAYLLFRLLYIFEHAAVCANIVLFLLPLYFFYLFFFLQSLLLCLPIKIQQNGNITPHNCILTCHYWQHHQHCKEWVSNNVKNRNWVSPGKVSFHSTFYQWMIYLYTSLAVLRQNSYNLYIDSRIDAAQ